MEYMASCMCRKCNMWNKGGSNEWHEKVTVGSCLCRSPYNLTWGNAAMQTLCICNNQWSKKALTTHEPVLLLQVSQTLEYCFHAADFAKAPGQVIVVLMGTNGNHSPCLHIGDHLLWEAC
jgi:hypothetical protein